MFYVEKRGRGIICILAAALLFSTGGLFVKMIPWSPLAINGFRCTISVIMMGTFMAVTKRRVTFNRWVLVGAAAVCATNMLYAAANKLTTAANTIVLQFTAPVFIILLMWLFFKQKPGKLDVITCIVVLGGIVLFFVGSMSAGGMLGNALALLSGLTYAGVFMLGTLPKSDPMSSVLMGHALSMVIGLPFLCFETDFTLPTMAFAVALGVFQMGLGYICFTTGIRTTPPVAASLISGIEPVLNPVWVAVFYGEAIPWTAIVGGVIVVGAIIVYNILKVKRGSTVA